MRYKDIETKIENAKMQKMIDEKTDEPIAYRIAPVEGYKLHSESRDEEIVDPETLDSTGDIKLGYVHYPSFVQVGYDYDFKNVMDGEYNGEKVTKVGKYGFFTVKDEEKSKVD